MRMLQLLSNHLNTRSRLGDCFFILHHTSQQVASSPWITAKYSLIKKPSQHSPSSLTMWNKSSLEGELLDPPQLLTAVHLLEPASPRSLKLLNTPPQAWPCGTSQAWEDSFMIYTLPHCTTLNSPSWLDCLWKLQLFSHLTLEAALIESSSSHSQECSEHSLA